MRKKRSNPETPSAGDEYSKMNFSLLASVFFIAITTIFPLYFTRTGYSALTKDKADFFLFLTFATVAAIFIALFITLDRKRPFHYIGKSLLNNRPIAVCEYAMGVFLLLTLASAIASPWNDFVWNGFTWDGYRGRWEGFWAFFAYGLTFLIIARFYQPKRLHFVIFACGAIVLAFYGILQYFGFDILYRIGFLIVGQADPAQRLTLQFRATLGNINVVSAYAGLVAALFAALYAGEKSKLGFFYLAASALAFAMLLITRGYAGFVGLFGAMGLMLPYWISSRERLAKILIVLASWSALHTMNHFYIMFLRSRPQIFWPTNPTDRNLLHHFTPSIPVLFILLTVVLLAAGLALLLVVKKVTWPERVMKIAGLATVGAMIIAALLFVEIVGARREHQPNNMVWQAREMLRGRLDDHFGNGRGWVWRAGFSVIRYNPWLGTGPDTFFFALGGVQILDVRYTVLNPQFVIDAGGLHFESMRVLNTWFDKAHNTFLQKAVCLGVPALLVFLFFLGALFVPAIKKAFNQPLLLACAAGALSFFIQSFFQVDTPIDRPVIYIVLGVMAVELSRSKSKVESVEVDVSDVKETV